MSGQQVGYTRVSSLDQSVARQLDGVTLDRTFTDSASGRSTGRPGTGGDARLRPRRRHRARALDGPPGPQPRRPARPGPHADRPGTDPCEVERSLLDGELACPGCGGVLAPWGYARRRSSRRERDTVAHRPRRACCSGCGVTHVLLPARTSMTILTLGCRPTRPHPRPVGETIPRPHRNPPATAVVSALLVPR